MIRDDLLSALLTGEDHLVDVARALDDIAAASSGMWFVQDELSQLVASLQAAGLAMDTPGALLLVAASDAATYRLNFSGGRTSFDPYLFFPDTTEPKHVEAQPADVVSRWKSLLPIVTKAVWRSRFAHLLVAADQLVGAERVALADVALTAYLDIDPDWGDGLDGVDAMRAALGLARQFRLTDRRTQVVAVMVRAAQKALEAHDPAVGTVLALTESLVDLRDHAPPEVDGLLDAARVSFAGDPHVIDQVFVQQIARAGVDLVRRGAVCYDRVQAWLDAAEQEKGVRRAFFLQTAVKHAVASGDSQLRRHATSRMQSSTFEQLELVRVRTGVVLRGEDIAQRLRMVTDAPDWESALAAFARMGPPTGDVVANRRLVENLAGWTSSVIPRDLYGRDGLLRFTARTEEELVEYNLSRQEMHALALQGPLIGEALLRLPCHHEVPSVDDIAAYLSRSPRIAPLSVTLAIGDSFHRWWAGDYTGSAFIVVPHIETLARNLLLAVDTGIYRLQREAKPGQYPPLGTLLLLLWQRGLDESWYRYLYTLLVSPTGMNLRNEMAHGFLVGGIDLGASALFLHCATFLAGLLLPFDAPAAAMPAEEASTPNVGP